MAGYERLDWDSDFFGFPIARVDGEVAADELAAGIAGADDDGVRCLYLLCPADDDGLLGAALDLGFRPYDVRVELDRRLGEPTDSRRPDPGSVREATTADGPILEEIARDRMCETRFWNDPHFPRNRVADLYAAWVRRGMTTSDRLTLVAGAAGGFVTCHFDRDAEVGSIELIAVAAGAAGRGLGGELVAAADHAFLAARMSKATVVTQARNITAQRLYQRRGYRTSRSDLWLHRWAN